MIGRIKHDLKFMPRQVSIAEENAAHICWHYADQLNEDAHRPYGLGVIPVPRRQNYP